MIPIFKSAVSAISKSFYDQKPPTYVSFRFDLKGVSGWEYVIKRLEASDSFTVKHKSNRVYGKNGNYVEAVAIWGDTLEFDEAGQRYRYRTLLIRHHDEGFGIAIRAVGEKKPTSLPGIDFTHDEINLLFKIADEVSDPQKEILVELENTARKRTDHALWAEPDSYPQDELLRILQSSSVRNTFLIGVLGGIDCYRINRPKFAVNLLIPRGSGTNAAESAKRILRTLDIAATSASDGCPTIVIKEKNDIVSWAKRHHRLSILSYANEKAIRPIWKEAETASLEERKTNLPSQPILMGCSSLPPEWVLQIDLPSEAPQTTAFDLKILRAAATNLMRNVNGLSQHLVEEFHWQKVSGLDYLLPYPTLVFQAFSRAVGKILFPTRNLYNSYIEVCGESEAEMQVRLEEESRVIHKSVEMLLNPSLYQSQIISKPDTDTAAKDALSRSAVAFRSDTKDGGVLCFTEASLLRLLSGQGLNETLLARFIQELKSSGVIKHKTETIHFKSSTNGRYIAIPVRKCQYFSVSAITA